jgi:hypothetical protein
MHHSDEQKIRIIRNSGFNVCPLGAEMRNKEIENTIVNMKGWWDEKTKGFQIGEIGES